jgi:hypothetical protein
MGQVWVFVAGLPVGALSAWAAYGTPLSPTALAFAAAGGGAALWVAWAAARAIRIRSGGRLASFAVAALALLLAGAALVAVAAAVAARGAVEYQVTEARAAAIFDLDAAVVTLPLPRCAATPAGSAVLLDRGARPRLDAEGRLVWFDAHGPDGRRQVHRLDRASGRVVCWTCGEAGNNWRPAPADRGFGVVFETDRHATPWDPSNTEIHLVSGQGEQPKSPSRRLTYAPGPDGYAVLRSAARLLLWSRREGGRYAVVSAPLRSAHGGLNLGNTTVLESAGATWTAPLAWSPDGRTLVVARGNPFHPVSARGIDLATGHTVDLGSGVALGGVAFGGDGGWVAVASTRRGGAAGWLSDGLGFLLAPFAERAARDRSLYRDTGIRTGEPWGRGAALDVGALAVWGEPTGLALSPDGSVLFLGQRRAIDGRIEERLVEITLDCGTGSG